MPSFAFLTRLILITVAAITIGVGWQVGPALVRELLPGGEPRPVVARTELPLEERSIIDTFQHARESVVSITTQTRFRDPWSRRTTEVPSGTGSGFVWDELGHIITNNHVIEGANGAVVTLSDGEAYPASLVGRDPTHDLAVLRIENTQTPPLPLGTSSDLQVGQQVLAIGNPFGLDWTLTTGIVSALDREFEVPGTQPLRGLIQTDAAINPGNSGGPLLDSAGRLVGVNTAIFSPSGGSAGIGFAVPVDVVNRVVPQLIETGRYVPPTIGIDADERVNELARRQGLEGVLVLGVARGSPAEEAGLQPARVTNRGALVPGDIIVSVAGIETNSVNDLLAALDEHRPGDAVELVYSRNGQQRTVTVTLASER